MQFYGFLHLSETESSTVNVSVRSFKHKVDTYLKNASVLSRSLTSRGHRLQILTNQRKLIFSLSPEIARELDIVEITFSTTVPSGVRFYSGHYKVDVFRYLGEHVQDYCALIDLDMLCINEAPDSLRKAEKENTALHYDITDQVVASSGEAHLRNQLEEILERNVTLSWSGGEFLAGPPRFFTDLAKAVDEIFDRYLEVSVGRYRVGNEPYQNAAIEILRSSGWHIEDAGGLGIVGRYWNMPVKHQQPPFRAFQQTFLLHLPVDKHVLSVIHSLPIRKSQSYLTAYRWTKLLWLPLEIVERLKGVLKKNFGPT